MFRRWFLDHPHSVGENYFQHQRMALGFSAALLAAAAACFVHALVPGLFQRTGSGIVTRLHDRMVVHRTRQRTLPGAPREAARGRARISPLEN